MLYGVTGSGKTHTVFGSLGYKDHQSSGEHEPGIIYHSMKQLMDVAGVSVSISYVEIYNEQVKDLLGVEDNLMITENSQGEVVIQRCGARDEFAQPPEQQFQPQIGANAFVEGVFVKNHAARFRVGGCPVGRRRLFGVAPRIHDLPR